jgi:hypothetical protein
MAQMQKYWGQAPNAKDPTPAPVQLARAGASHTPSAPPEEVGPTLTSDQTSMMERILASGAPSHQQDAMANVALRIPQEQAPDLFGADLPNTLDPELMRMIETA